MSTGLRVYVAGPYTQGDQLLNVQAATLAADAIDSMGHVWFVPHLSHFHDQLSGTKRDWRKWMEWCLAWVERCDVLLRIPGVSPGADQEVIHARRNGIPVVFSLQELSSL